MVRVFRAPGSPGYGQASGAFTGGASGGGLLDAASGGGGLLGGGSGTGSWQDFWNSDAVLPAAAALIAGPTFRQGLAGAFQQAGAGVEQGRKRRVLNDVLKSTKIGADLSPETQAYLRENPDFANNLIAYNLTPHPKQFIPLATGEIGIGDPIAGTVTSAGMLSGGGGVNGQPPGFISLGAQQFKDESTGESGLIDRNGLKFVTGHAAPTSDQAGAAGAAALARRADALIRQTQAGQTGVVGAIQHQTASIPFLGAAISGPESRGFDTGKAEYINAMRNLAIAKGLNPDTIDFNEKALFPQQGDGPEEIASKDAYREQMIVNMDTRAGPFAQSAPAQPKATGAGAVPTIKSDADYNKLQKGTTFIDPEGNRRVKP